MEPYEVALACGLGDGESVARSGWARAIRAVYLRYYALSTAYAAPRWVWIGMDEPYEHERGAM